MIVTLTLNPSVDRTVEVEALARGEVTRAVGGQVDPGGKGINVSRALAAHGLPTRAVVTLGGAEGDHLVALLQDTGIDIVPVRITIKEAVNDVLAQVVGFQRYVITGGGHRLVIDFKTNEHRDEAVK